MKTNTMLKYLLTFLFTSFLLISLPDYAIGQNAGDTHTVQAGETIYSIARDYEIDAGDIRRWNQLQDDNLQPGQELKIGPPSEEEDATTHTVEQGETLFAISRMYDVTIAELQAWNNLDDINLRTGQTLLIYEDEADEEEMAEEEVAPPTDTELREIDRESIVRDRETRGSNTYYTVRSGDTLTRIASEHGMSVSELRSLNNLENDNLSIGQRLTVRDVQSAPSIAESSEESTPQGKFVNHRIDSGQSLEDLLESFQMSRTELRLLNPDTDIEQLSSGQRVTVLLPTTRVFDNPYEKRASLENLGEVHVTVYDEGDSAKPTTSGELYNPQQLTAAHSNISLGNVVYIENPENGIGIYVKVNDRHSGNGLKISQKAFDMLQFSSLQNAQVAIYLD